MSLIDQSERQDFALLTAAAGFDPVDFQVTAVQGRVTVTRKSNRLQMSYPAGHECSSWVLTFESDLREGKFGPV